MSGGAGVGGAVTNEAIVTEVVFDTVRAECGIRAERRADQRHSQGGRQQL